MTRKKPTPPPIRIGKQIEVPRDIEIDSRTRHCKMPPAPGVWADKQGLFAVWSEADGEWREPEE